MRVHVSLSVGLVLTILPCLHTSLEDEDVEGLRGRIKTHAPYAAAVGEPLDAVHSRPHQSSWISATYTHRPSSISIASTIWDNVVT